MDAVTQDPLHEAYVLLAAATTPLEKLTALNKASRGVGIMIRHSGQGLNSQLCYDCEEQLILLATNHDLDKTFTPDAIAIAVESRVRNPDLFDDDGKPLSDGKEKREPATKNGHTPEPPPDDTPPADKILDGPVALTEPKGKPPKAKRQKAIAAVVFDMGKEGTPKPTCANARAAVKALGITCRYDRFHDRYLVGGQPIAQYAGELTDQACLVLRQMIFEQFNFDPGRYHIFDACVQLCLEGAFDPVLEYLDALEWDGTKRLDTWPQKYLGTADTPLNSAIGRLALLAMVRRARQPGCKFDQIIMIEGPEGMLKSTALAALAGANENFSDQTILGLNDQQQQERLRGKWVYEISDLSGIHKAQVEQVKAFASRTHDRARPAYGRAQIELPRRCVIFGTTNEETYLKSRTGNRRFWPMRCGSIDIEALRRDRDQLLAEAATVEETGEPLVLPKDLWTDARAEQEERLEHDPWLDSLASMTGTIFASATGDEERIAVDEILGTKLGIPPAQQNDGLGRRLASVLRKLGWEGPKVMRFGSVSKRGYKRPTGLLEQEESLEF